jgi:parallel beta-helix repeat protein
LLLTTYMVTNTASNGPGSLCQAITDVNLDTTPDTIDFAIGGGGPQTISLQAALPAIANTVTIDGTSQSGYSGTPLISVDATGAGFFSDGLDVSAPNTVVEGMAFINAGSDGINIFPGANDTVIKGDFLGVNPQTMQAAPNGTEGLEVCASNCTIGGTVAGDRNVISGNAQGGLIIEGSSASANLVIGNLIGTADGPIDGTRFGFPVIPNMGDGIDLQGSSNNIIGEPGTGNLIGANTGVGISVFFGSSSNLIQGNAIGTTLDTGTMVGTGPDLLGNGSYGIELNSSSSNTIGGKASGAGNVVSHNNDNGIFILGGVNTGNNNLLQGNLIGTDAAGKVADPNASDGILLANTTGNTIGGLSASASNLISGNSSNGLHISGASASGNLVEGNSIGIGSDGVTQVSNAGNGIFIDGAPGNSIVTNLIGDNNLNGIMVQSKASSGNVIQGNLIGTDSAQLNDELSNLLDGIEVENAPDNLIGGPGPTDGNVVSFNFGNGISIKGPDATGNVLLGNIVGLSADGTGFDSNLLNGVFIENAGQNTIGGINTLNPDGTIRVRLGNVISANNESGILSDYNPDSPLTEGVGYPDHNLIEGNLIGTDVTGTQLGLGNLVDGIDLFNSSFDTIGGTTPGSGNVISGNNNAGMLLLGPTHPSVADGLTRGTEFNLIEGNLIGTDVTGRNQVRNTVEGLEITQGVDNTIGGTTPGARNIISGNKGPGVHLDGVFTAGGVAYGTTDNFIIGNYIGTDVTGTAKLIDPDDSTNSFGNFGDGVLIESGASGNFIGGTAPGEGNLISGNGQSGVELARNASDNLVLGNLIGTDFLGLNGLGNAQEGITINSGAAANTIGGPVSGAGNVISGNSIGVTITNAGSSNNLLQGNIIGLNSTGSNSLGNTGFGVVLLSGVTGNTIGGISAGSRNVISGNGQGVGIVGPNATGNLVEGNYVGLDSTGSLPRGNFQLGLFLNGAADNTIGGTVAGSGNVISGNSGVGLYLFGSGTSGNLVAGNLIGLDATGSRTAASTGASLGNLNFGIAIGNAPNNTIGGTTPSARNVISGNRQAGIDVNGSQASGTVIQGNYVGLDSTGTLALGNQADGVQIDNAPGALIGGPSAASRNVISGNQASGIEIDGSTSTGAAIEGNYVGTEYSGLKALGNGQSGVFVNAAPGVTIGGTTASLRNVISGNTGNGVRIFGNPSSSLVEGNYLGADATGRAALGNGNDGVLLDGTTGVTIGGTSAGSINVISGNAASGVEFGGASSTGDVVLGNRIGTDSDGVLALGNSTGVFLNDAPANFVLSNVISGNVGPGVYVLGASASNNTVTSNLIGTDVSGLDQLGNNAGVYISGASANTVSSNLISGNSSAGVVIDGSASTANVIQGNLIGPDATGNRVVLSISPQQSGVFINDAPGNVVGGLTGSARNVISGDLVGVVIAGFNAQHNLVVGNYLGTNASGTAAIANQSGVYVNGSPNNTIGGTSAGSGNVISGNTATGIDLYGTLTTGNLIQGNLIGTNASGTAAVPNSSGVYMELASSNTVGGATASAGNLISGNTVAGVYLFNLASDNLVERNRIGITATGKKLGNHQYGVLLYNAANNNVVRSGPTTNTIANSGIGNFREFTGAVAKNSGTSKPTKTKVKTKAKPKTVVKAAHPTGPKVSAKSISHRGSAAKSASNHRTGH